MRKDTIRRSYEIPEETYHTITRFAELEHQSAQQYVVSALEAYNLVVGKKLAARRDDERQIAIFSSMSTEGE